jgi:hypothetical protein
MPFEPLPESTDVYVDREGKSLELSVLAPHIRKGLLELIRFYNWNPPYPQFRTWWRDRTSPIGPFLEGADDTTRLLKAVGKDMEIRLGLSQGRLEE